MIEPLSIGSQYFQSRLLYLSEPGLNLQVFYRKIMKQFFGYLVFRLIRYIMLLCDYPMHTENWESPSATAFATCG